MGIVRAGSSGVGVIGEHAEEEPGGIGSKHVRKEVALQDDTPLGLALHRGILPAPVLAKEIKPLLVAGALKLEQVLLQAGLHAAQVHTRARAQQALCYDADDLHSTGLDITLIKR